MLAARRAVYLDRIKWNQFRERRLYDAIVVVECWKYDGMSAREGENYRVLTLAEQSRQSGVERGEVEDRIEDWLQRKVSEDGT